MTEARRSLKGLVRLLQFLVRAPAGVVPERLDLVLTHADGTSRRFPKSLVEACAARGLLTLENGRCTPKPEARAALKRLIAQSGMEFAGQHALLAEEERLVGTERTRVLVNQDSSALMQLSRLKDKEGNPWFAAEAIAAGERLAADFHFAGLQPRMTASWAPRLDSGQNAGRGGQAELSDSVADARRRVSRAASALGPELAGVALDVCCFSKGLELVERERNWPARSAKLMLRAALMALARHYGMCGEGRARAKGRGNDQPAVS